MKDASGNDVQLKEGDLVTVEMRVVRVATGAEQNNIVVETVHPMVGSGEPFSMALNSNQVEKV